jgi:hypothetical protein
METYGMFYVSAFVLEGAYFRAKTKALEEFQISCN